MNHVYYVVLAAALFALLQYAVFMSRKRVDLLEKIKKERDEATQVKDYLITYINREIRSVMSNIIGLTEILATNAQNQQNTLYLKDIRACAESLLGTVGDMTDLNKLSEGKIQITATDVDLYSVLKHNVSMMSFSARSKGLDFIEDIRIDVSECVVTDEVRLNHIIINLLSNAIKFTTTGFVKFTAKIEAGPEGDGKKNLVFEIADTGIGIKRDAIPLLFSYEKQVGDITDFTIMESGIGLTISKYLAKLLGGDITVVSEFEKGSVFTLTIPYVKGDASNESKKTESDEYIYAPNAQVLIVDDMHTNLTVASGIMRLFGITADIAVNGREAVRLIKHKDYDIVFMDYMMPEMSGIEATREIRGLGGKYETLPVIALTAHTMDNIEEEFKKSGMSDYLLKPIDMTTLTYILHKWLPAEKMESGPPQMPASENIGYSDVLFSASKIVGLDIRLALGRLKGMQNLLETALKQMSRTIEGQLKKMDEFLSEGDLRDFAICAHGFKSSLAAVGASYASEMASELEIAAKSGNMLFCTKRFAVFTSDMERLAYELKALFPTAADGNTPRGTVEFLALKIGDILDCLNNFEAKEALERVNELMAFTFGEEADKIIKEVKTAIMNFNYNSATSLLIKQLPGKAGRF